MDSRISSLIKGVLVAVAIIALGGVGFFGSSCAAAMYQDHLLLNQIRANSEQQLRNAAAQVDQFQKQQGGGQAPAAAPTPAK